MMRAGLAGLAYCAVVFAAGFGLGTFRVLVLAPILSESVAVLLELPVILVISWMACRWITARLHVPTSPSARFVMGAAALFLLLTLELAVSFLGFGRSLSEHIAQYRQLPSMLGLAGQLAFATFPLLQRARPRSRKQAR